jgi:hypothetical protein
MYALISQNGDYVGSRSCLPVAKREARKSGCSVYTAEEFPDGIEIYDLAYKPDATEAELQFQSMIAAFLLVISTVICGIYMDFTFLLFVLPITFSLMMSRKKWYA